MKLDKSTKSYDAAQQEGKTALGSQAGRYNFIIQCDLSSQVDCQEWLHAAEVGKLLPLWQR